MDQQQNIQPVCKCSTPNRSSVDPVTRSESGRKNERIGSAVSVENVARKRDERARGRPGQTVGELDLNPRAREKESSSRAPWNRRERRERAGWRKLLSISSSWDRLHFLPSCLTRRGRRHCFLPPLPRSACRYVTLPQAKAGPSMTPTLRQVHDRLVFWVTFNRIGSTVYLSLYFDFRYRQIEIEIERERERITVLEFS